MGTQSAAAGHDWRIYSYHTTLLEDPFYTRAKRTNYWVKDDFVKELFTDVSIHLHNIIYKPKQGELELYIELYDNYV